MGGNDVDNKHKKDTTVILFLMTSIMKKYKLDIIQRRISSSNNSTN